MPIYSTFRKLGYLLVAVIVLLPVSQIFGAAKDDSLRIIIALEKTQQTIGLPIILRVSAENKTSHALRIIRYDSMTDLVAMETKSGELLKRRLITSAHGGPARCCPSVGARATLFLGHPNILGFLGYGGFLGAYYLPAGEYSIYHRTLPSDTVQIVILPPDEQEEAAWKALQQILDHPTNVNPHGDLREYFDEFLQQYPNSNYCAFVLFEAIAEAWITNVTDKSNNIFRYSLRLMNDFPRSIYAMAAMNHIDPDMLTRAQADQLKTALARLKVESPYQSISDQAVEKLEQLSRKF